jgi:hypothetical protein
VALVVSADATHNCTNVRLVKIIEKDAPGLRAQAAALLRTYTESSTFMLV